MPAYGHKESCRCPLCRKADNKEPSEPESKAERSEPESNGWDEDEGERPRDSHGRFLPKGEGHE